MDNSISIDINSGNNAMNSLSFYWKAEFKNGDVVNQFETEKDDKFKLVQDRLHELKYFYLYNKSNFQDRFIVDLENGFIFRNNIIEYSSKEKIKKNIRLINFRTVQKIFSENITLLKTIVRYKLGFQYNDENNINRKIILIIDEQGNWVLGE
jgi:hypothetical protein